MRDQSSNMAVHTIADLFRYRKGHYTCLVALRSAIDKATYFAIFLVFVSPDVEALQVWVASQVLANLCQLFQPNSLVFQVEVLIHIRWFQVPRQPTLGLEARAYSGTSSTINHEIEEIIQENADSYLNLKSPAIRYEFCSGEQV